MSFARKFVQRLGEKLAWRMKGGNGGPRPGKNMWPVYDALNVLYDPSSWMTSHSEREVRQSLRILVNAQPVRAIAATRPCGVTIPDLTPGQMTMWRDKIRNGLLTDDDKSTLVDRLVASWRSFLVVGTPSLSPVEDASARSTNRYIDPLSRGADLCRYFQIMSEIHPGGSAFLWFGAEYLSWNPTNTLSEVVFSHLKITLPSTRIGFDSKVKSKSKSQSL